MSETAFARAMREHHDRQSMPEPLVGALERLTSAYVESAPRPARDAYRLSRALGWAAALILAVFSAQAWWRLEHAELRLAGLQQDLGAAQQRLAALETGPAPDWPRFVAVRLAASDCPYCEKTRAVFDELAREYALQDVLFVTLDPATSAGQGRVAQVLRDLRLDWARTDCQQCCAVRLLDRRQRTVAATQLALAPSDAFRSEFSRLLANVRQ